MPLELRLDFERQGFLRLPAILTQAPRLVGSVMAETGCSPALHPKGLDEPHSKRG